MALKKNQNLYGSFELGEMPLKTPEQLKAAIRNIAKEKQLKPQEVLQMFLFERILDYPNTKIILF